MSENSIINLFGQPKGIYEDEKVALLVDGMNLYNQVKNQGYTINWKALAEYLEGICIFKRVYFFTTIPADSKFKKTLDWMQYTHFATTYKETREFDGKRQYRSTDIDFTLAAVRLLPHIDNFLIATGDADFLPLVNFLRIENSKKVGVMGLFPQQVPGQRNQSFVADSLVRNIDYKFNLLDYYVKDPVKGEEELSILNLSVEHASE